MVNALITTMIIDSQVMAISVLLHAIAEANVSDR
jgi:hypothetical protein